MSVFFSLCVHAIDHIPKDSTIPDMSPFALPVEVTVVIRCLALGISVDVDRMVRVARMLLPMSSDKGVEPSSDQLREVLRKKVEEIQKLPMHIILNEKIWSQRSDKI